MSVSVVALAGQGGAGAASIGIGNYKGVMLCNRPFGGLAAAAKVTDTSAAGGKGPFRCGCIADEIGIQVRREVAAGGEGPSNRLTLGLGGR